MSVQDTVLYTKFEIKEYLTETECWIHKTGLIALSYLSPDYKDKIVYFL